MRITVLGQFAKGLIHSDPKSGKEFEKHLESTKWYLWHGNVEKALDKIEDCYFISIAGWSVAITYIKQSRFL